MRVIAGYLKGRTLESTRSRHLRPATDRVKETIFNILHTRMSIEGSTVLDLFAGTGSLGIEAISRGADHAVFVDNSEPSLRVLRSNLSRLGCGARCTVLNADAFAYMARPAHSFDLIFADPPYVFQGTGSIPEKVVGNNLLKKGGFLIIEHARKALMASSPELRLLLQKEFGQTVVSFFTARPTAAGR